MQFNDCQENKYAALKIYLVFSLGGRRLFITQSITHQGMSFSSSVPSKSVIFFLQEPLWEPSVMMDGGDAEENSKGWNTAESLSVLPSTSTLEVVKILVDTSFPDGTSPMIDDWDPNFCLLSINQWTNSPLSVSRAKLTYNLNAPANKKIHPLLR